jgi:hypothetical protein
MALNKFNRLTRNAAGTIVTESGYVIHPRVGPDGERRFSVCWDTIRGDVAGRFVPTLLAARRFIEMADGSPESICAHGCSPWCPACGDLRSRKAA